MSLSSFHKLIVPHKTKSVNRQFGYNIRIYPEIANYSRQNKLQNQFVFSSILKSLNVSGSGWLSYPQTIKDLKTYFNYSQSKIYSLLKSGGGIFFDIIEHRVIRLYSYEQVARQFDIKFVTQSKMLCIKGLKTGQIRAYMYSSIFKTLDWNGQVNPISTLVIKEVTGIKPRTQRRYDIKASNICKSNYSSEMVVHQTKNKTYIEPKQLGNSYQSTRLKIGSKIAKRKLNKKLRGNVRLVASESASRQNQVVKYCVKPNGLNNLLRKDYYAKLKTDSFTLWESMPKFVS